MKIVLDTNILVSAMGWDGNERKVLMATLALDIDLILSDAMVSELLKVLSYQKFSHLPVDVISRFVEIVMETAMVIETASELSVIREDPADNRILECAVDGDAGYIVTDDTHLLKLKEYRGIRIVRAKDFLTVLR